MDKFDKQIRLDEMKASPSPFPVGEAGQCQASNAPHQPDAKEIVLGKIDYRQTVLAQRLFALCELRQNINWSRAGEINLLQKFLEIEDSLRTY
jgi:hypothetical protein